MSQKRFFNNFTAQDFSQASHDFLNLTQNEQQDVLKQLYYQARDAKVPIALGVLYHKLHDGKTFEDFYNAWLPPQEFMRPFNLGEKTYYHYSDIPLRVLNAVNMEDPTEIISVVIMWCERKNLQKKFKK